MGTKARKTSIHVLPSWQYKDREQEVKVKCIHMKYLHICTASIVDKLKASKTPNRKT